MTKTVYKTSGKLTDFKRECDKAFEIVGKEMGVTAMCSLYLDGQKYLSCSFARLAFNDHEPAC